MTQPPPRGPFQIRWISSAAIAIAVLFTAAIVFALMGLAVPLMDDTCRMGTWPLQPNAGVWAYDRFLYLERGGRWAAGAIQVWALTSLAQPQFYPFLLISLVAVQFLIAFFAFKLLLRDSRIAVAITAVLACVCYATMPYVQETIYWFNGAVEDQLPLALVALVFSLLLFDSTSKGSARDVNGRVALAVGLGLLPAAFHELWGIGFALMVTGITALLIAKKRGDVSRWASVAAAAWVGFLINYVAPGNRERMGQMPGNADLSATLILLRDFLGHQLLPWLFDLKHWSVAVLLWVDPRLRLFIRKHVTVDSIRELALFIGSWLALVILAFVAAAWHTGPGFPGRTRDIVYELFLIGWLASAGLAAPWIGRLPFLQMRREALRQASLMVLAAMILASGNVRSGAKDLFNGSAAAWRRESNERFLQLRNGGDLAVRPIQTYPFSYAPWDITNNVHDWRNGCLARAFGAASVRLSQDGAADRH